MSYEVKLRTEAQRQLDKFGGKDYQAVAKAVSALEQEPRPHGVKKLAESSLWRIRVGRYRVVFHIIDSEQLVIVVRIAKRTEVTYKGL